MGYEILEAAGRLFLVEPCCCDSTKRTLTPIEVDDSETILRDLKQISDDAEFLAWAKRQLRLIEGYEKLVCGAPDARTKYPERCGPKRGGRAYAL